MFDHQDGVFPGDTLDQGGDLVDVFMAHAGHRLVERHHFRIERQRRRDLKRALVPIGPLDRRRLCKFAQADIVEQFAGTVIESIEHGFRAPEIEGVPVLALQRDPHILQRGQMRERGRNLKRTHQAEACHIRGRQRRDVLPLVQNSAR